MRALRLAAVLVATTAIALPTTTALAAPGDLDTSWDTDGIRFDPAMSGEAIAVQSDGKVLTGSRFDAGLFRHNADGTPDNGFGSSGFVALNQGVRDIVIQSDGKIVVAGGDGDLWVARFNTDGTPDTSFDTDGEAFAGFAGGQGLGVALASGGRIVVAGESNNDFAVARFTSSGAPDTSFDTDGRQIVDFGGSDTAREVVVQSSGRTVLTGDSNGDFALAGLTDAGALDGTFGAGGLRTTDFGGSEQGYGSALLSDGRIVVVGHRDSDVFAVALYTAGGTLDSSCDGDGTFEINFVAGFQEGRDVAVQFNDRFVVTGIQGGNAATARFEPDDCAPDTSFGGGDGQVVQPITEGNGAEAIAINSSTGRILVVGSIAGEPPDQLVFAYLGDEPPDDPPPPQDPPPEEPPPPDPCANDRTGPTVTIRSVQDRTLYRQTQSPSSVRVEASDASGLRTDPSDPNRPISTQQAGLFTVTATATDNCNNQTTATFKYRVAGEPEIGLAGVRASCTASNFIATIRIDADVSLTSVIARLNGRTIARGTRSRLSFKVRAKQLRAGRHRITISTRDRAGNRGTLTVSFARCVVVEPSFTG